MSASNKMSFQQDPKRCLFCHFETLAGPNSVLLVEWINTTYVSAWTSATTTRTTGHNHNNNNNNNNNNLLPPPPPPPQQQQPQQPQQPQPSWFFQNIKPPAKQRQRSMPPCILLHDRLWMRGFEHGLLDFRWGEGYPKGDGLVSLDWDPSYPPKLQPIMGTTW